jgi:phosphopantetheinyl transferase
VGLLEKRRGTARNEPHLGPARRNDDRAVSTSREQPRVELWAALVSRSTRSLRGRTLLDDDDRRWCARLRLPAARSQFAAGHVLLRLALTEAVHGSTHPAAWRFARDEHGKPRLAPGPPALNFSLSHEHPMVVAAVCATSPVGIDVARMVDRPRALPVWSAAAPSERILLSEESPDKRAHDFARLWALKEAYAKMIGLGTALDFSAVEVDLARRRLRRAGRECRAALQTHTLWDRDDCYFVALAVEAEPSARIDSRGHLVDLTGGSWFVRAEISPQEAVWPKRWQWHWLG